MKIKYIWLCLVLMLPVAFINDVESRINTKSMENIITMTIDSFEVVGNWKCKYSNYRSKTFTGVVENIEREPNENWIKWIGIPGNGRGIETPEGFVPEDILPDGIIKDHTLRDKEQVILALKASWDFKGHNWVVIEPNTTRTSVDGIEEKYSLYIDMRDGKDLAPLNDRHRDSGHYTPFIWLSGKTKKLFVYVWGCGRDYELEGHVEDFKGNVHIVSFGKLTFRGWRNLSADIPVRVLQQQNSFPSIQPLKFLRFKINASSNAENKNFYIYFDYLHATVDIYEEPYFGQSLQDFQKIWGNNSTSVTVTPIPD